MLLVSLLSIMQPLGIIENEGEGAKTELWKPVAIEVCGSVPHVPYGMAATERC